jgi:hypothetical protein
MTQNSNKYYMKQVFFIFLRFIDYRYVSLPTLQITQGAPSKFKDPQSAPSDKKFGKPCIRPSSEAFVQNLS